MVQNRSKQPSLEKLLEENSFLDRVFHCIQDGIILTDPEGKITFLNPHAERILGISEEKLLGTRAVDIPVAMHTHDGEKLTSNDQPFELAIASKMENPAPQQVILKRTDGSTFPVLFNVGRAENGQMVAVLTDLSDFLRKQRQMEEYFNLVAHDLRAPLTATLGHSELLEKELLSAEDMKISYKAIHSASGQMLELVESITDRMRIENDNFSLVKKDVCLAELVFTVVSQLAIGDWYRPICTEIPENLLVHADPNLLRRVIVNLVSNAIKYSPQNMKININGKGNNKGAVLTISDSGKGIDSHDIPYLFEPYFVSEDGRTKEGVGLGLYIAYKVVKAHGGNIFACSQIGQGSTFAVFLPHKT